MQDKDYYIHFKNVNKSYDGKTLIVKDLNLGIRKGEFITMLGPSGSGKTTCLMMLAGFESVSQGHIYINNEPINTIPPHQRNIGMVFQNYALFPHMTVAENLAYPLKVRKRPKKEIKAKVEEKLRLVELQSFKDRFPKQLSGGQKQRIALARALIFEPEIILMDEPLGALDKRLREQMQYEIKHLHNNLGFTSIYITHDQAEALTMSDRIALFHHGSIQQIDTPESIYNHPDNIFVANFIGENNCLSSELIEQEGEGVLVRLQNGIQIQARSAKVHTNKNITLSIRPERVFYEPSKRQLNCENILQAKVIDSIYHGDHVRVYFQIAENKEFVMKTFHFGDESKHCTPGADLEIGWYARDCFALT